MLKPWAAIFHGRSPSSGRGGSGVLRLMAVVGLWLAGGTVASAEMAAYVAALAARAEQAALAQTPEWRNLLHYRTTWLGRTKSLVDDPRFFLAPAGKTDPQAELAATLAAFFEPLGTNIAEHAICRFVGRFHWLNEQLAFDPDRLPCTDCALYEKVAGHMRAQAVALVYPAAYMNGPASMFGHTLLVFDAANQNRLLSRAVSYAAQTRETIGPLFAFAGIFGLYPGYYAYQPYYDKVEQYGDIGHRDVWEYELDFTPEEVDRMLRHAWELQGIYSRYYFFDENCAFNLLYMLDVARPSLELTRRMPWFVIPIDTVKQVARRGIVRDVRYRPSSVTRIEHLAAALAPAERRLAREVARGRTTAADALAATPDRVTQTLILDLAAEYTQYLYTEETLPREVYTERLMETLRARSGLGQRDPALFPMPTPPRPDRGHAPARVSIGAGTRDDDAFYALRYRIAYHALTDNDDGFIPGAQIQFLRTEGRYYPERERFVLQHLDLVDVTSLAPRSAMFQPASWKVRVGVGQADFTADDRDRLWQANTGAGYTWGWGGGRLAYALIEGDAHLADYYRADYALGLGPALGVVATVGRDWKHVLRGKASYMGIGDDLWRLSAGWVQDYRFTPDFTLSLELAAHRHDQYDFLEAQVRLNRYF